MKTWTWIRQSGLLLVIVCAVGVYGMTSGCTADPPPAADESSTSESSALEANTDVLDPSLAATCPPCPLVRARLLRGEPVADVCNTNCANCGNGVCDNGETRETCSSDCPFTPPPPRRCGNGVCESGETASSCPSDCAPASCGNGRCEAGERVSCREDCCQFDDPPCPL
jgi:hypothetical protein